MRLLSHIACLSLALSLNEAGKGHEHHHGAALDRCKGMEMDAIALNEHGVPYFFKGDHLFKGFHGKVELANASFAELDEHHHLGHVDAAFRMHIPDAPEHHDHIFFFLDTKVFSYYNHTLEPGYPKDIQDVFPGIPDHLDAAVECPEEDCKSNLVIFFKGDDIYHFDVKTKKVDEKVFKGMPNCTSAFRWLGHYYCFHGHDFSKFDPMTGEVHGRYPKDARKYFMRCSKYGERKGGEKCSRVHLDAITSDDGGNVYAFRVAPWQIGIRTGNLLITGPTTFIFSNLFSLQDDKVFVYKIGEPHTHLEGYPKPLKEVLGIEGPVDAAFICKDHHIVHIIKGKTLYKVDMQANPRVPSKEIPFTRFKYVDDVMCGSDGVRVVVGGHLYHFESIMAMETAKHDPEPKSVPQELFGCDH
uniref:Hemopexin n=1 Tax=Denticeps clupeoides TaxID=299321 RepID=A0AAY4D795_9TELE